MATASLIKAQIKTYLDALKTAGTLGEVIEDDFKRAIQDRDFANFPVAILQTASIDCTIESTQSDLRDYGFEIIVLSLGDNTSSVTAIEDLQEAMLDKFAQSPTLNGTCEKSIPASSALAPFTNRGRNYIVFKFTLQAQKIKQLTFV